MYRAALQSILSELARQDRLVVVEKIELDQPKTKLLQQKLHALKLDNVLIVSDEVSENLYLSARNLPNVDVRDVSAADPVSLVRFDKVLITVPAVKKFDEVLALTKSVFIRFWSVRRFLKNLPWCPAIAIKWCLKLLWMPTS